MKSFYDENFRYTHEAQEVDGDVCATIHGVFEKWVAEGYSPREISHIVISAAMDREYSFVLDFPFTKNETETLQPLEQSELDKGGNNSPPTTTRPTDAPGPTKPLKQY